MIYIVEDDEDIRRIVCYALNNAGYEGRAFAQSTDFWAEISGELPELILLDIMLPKEDGLSILRNLRSNSRTGNIPVIMMTAKGTEVDKVTGLDMGADDYITKPFGITELVSRVRAVLRRSRSENTDKIYEKDGLFVDPKKHIIRVFGEETELSYKEYSLLLALLEADGDVVARDSLLKGVWGEFYDESRTLDVHIRKLRVKLKEAGELIQTVKGIGYKIKNG